MTPPGKEVSPPKHPFRPAAAVLKEAELDPFAREQADAFFRSDAGVSFLNTIAAMRPLIVSGKTPEEIMVAAGEASGYEKCLINVLTLVRPILKQEENQSTNYPDLEDDKQWQTS